MSKEYVTFVSNLDKLTENKEITIAIRALAPGPRKYECKIVKAIISWAKDKDCDRDTLWIRSWTGMLHPEPWAIKVLEEVDETLPGKTHEETGYDMPKLKRFQKPNH